ncbi:hypothetical protein Tco_0671611 [Tanacetum coccineum]
MPSLFLTIRLMDKPDDVVFRIHYNGVFKYDPLRYEQFRLVEMQACTTDRIIFSHPLDMLVAKLKDNIWSLLCCIHELYIESGGLKLIENNADVHAWYDLAEKHMTVDLFVAHLPRNLAKYYHHSLCLDGSDEKVTSIKKEHEIKKKDAGNMYVEELVVWAKEEANSPYLRFPPLKCRPFRNDMKSKVLFIDMYYHEDEGFVYYPSLNDDEVGKDNLVLRSCDLENEGMNDVAKTLDGMNDVLEGRIECVEGMNDAAKSVEFIDAVDVLTRQNKLDEGKRPMTDDDIVTSKKIKNSCRGNDVSIRENDKPVFSDDESDSDENADEYAHMFFESESDESDKSFDYLSNGEDEVIELRKGRIQFKNTANEVDVEEEHTKAEQDMRPNVDKNGDIDDHGLGLTPLIREHEKYIEVLLRKLKGSGVGRGVKEKIVVVPPLVEKPGPGGPMLERVTISGKSSGTQDGNVDCSTNILISVKKIGGGTKDSGDATNTPIDENISGPTSNVAANVTVSPTGLIPSGPTLYPKVVTSCHTPT